MLKFPFIEYQLHQMLANDRDPLNKVRAKFLVHSLIACLIIIIYTIPVFYSQGLNLLFIRSSVIGIVLIGLLCLTLYTTKWKIAAQISCIILAILIWSNIFFFIKGVNILSIQFTLMLIVLSYYLLGVKWGIFYSIITVIPMLLYFTLHGQEHIFMKVRPMEADSITFSLIFTFNFLLIIYLQYHFFNAFNSTIRQLSIKQEEEKLLNEKLREAIISAQESANAKSHFLSTISHELRTPLNGVIGMTDVLLMNKPRSDQEENLGLLKFSANSLLNLINNVLDFNKIESGKIEIENISFKIYDLVRNIYGGFKNKAEEKSLKFAVIVAEELKTVSIIGDPTRLTQVLVNLIENAVKFTAAGEVNVSIETVWKTNEEIRLKFCVSDTGIGIPLEKQEIIFDSFTQSSSSTTRKYGGTGLGLAIVKNLLDLMESRIITKSEKGKGTSFTFELSYKLSDDLNQNIEVKSAIPTNEIDISGLKILIAEDNEMNIILMQKLLANWNVVPDFAINGKEAVAALEHKNYDLVLMDIHMPIMDGYEAAIEIRRFKDEKKASVPIIALTASVALNVRNKVAEAGIDDFMSKPFKANELQQKLEAIFIKKMAKPVSLLQKGS